jgi:hypothetical protein
MAFEKRSPANVTNQANIGNGPYLARIISHLDPSFMGGLEVTLLRSQGNQMGEDTQTYTVRCATPFFGNTGFEFMGQNTANPKRTQGEQALNQQGTVGSNSFDAYNDTQKSYGMWMVPPDVGVTVLVVFVDGDPSQGYWIACVPPRFANHMVPAIGGSTEVDIDQASKQKYNTRQPLPVAEINKRINGGKDGDRVTDPEKIKKAVHPIADRFLEQGLLEDDVRGVTTTTARREVPSMVFGISTPGPLDRRNGAKKANIGTKEGQTNTPVPVSRLGGTQFVMDDGDDRFQRSTPAGTGPVKYANVLGGEKGDPTIPYNEYFRVRTRTGHQLLMHNSEDLIYIGNAKGTTWIELTSNGKIDIYAQDSISIHTQNDLNIKADRDINMEAGRNINLKTITGRCHMDVATDWKVTVGQNNQITVGQNWEHVVGAASKITTAAGFDVSTGQDNKFSAAGSTHIASGGRHYETATRIDMNGPSAILATAATPIEQLSLHQNPVTNTAVGWGIKYQDGTISSIMKRIPMHEPWILHENQAPQLLTPTQTDRDA